MSSLFSIGEDDLDLDDEDCLLAASDVGSSSNCITDNNSKTNSVSNLSSVNTQLLRTKDAEKPSSHYVRRPFDSISNINTGGRTCDKKRMPPEQLHRSFSLTNWPNNSTTSATSGFHTPVAKRFATDNTCNSSPKPSVSGNRGNLLVRSSSVPTFKSTESKAVMHSSIKTYPCNNSSTVPRSSLTTDSQIQELSQCNLKLSDSCNSSNRMDHINTVSTLSRFVSTTCTSRLLPRKEFSGLPDISCTGSKNICHSNMGNNNSSSSVWQQKRPSTSPVIYSQTDNVPVPIRNANTVSYNQTGRQSASTFNKNCIGTRVPETPRGSRQSAGTGPSTPQANQAGTPVMHRSLAKTPSSNRTPKSRKFPGPAGLLPKLSPGQNLDDASFASPLPATRKPSPVQSKISQSSTSEDDDFNRDPWTYMYQDFVKNVPLAMRYTIVRVYTEAIQQRLDHGKVPCLCALVKAFSLTEADASVLLKDPTGEIHGTLHRKVLENYQTELAAGAGLILKHVSVFSPAPRKHYLNITPGNILQIYPPDPQNMSSSQALASQCTQTERKKEGQRKTIEVEAISEQVDCNNSAEGSNEEEAWFQEDCFEDLLEGLDDDEDFLDEALLV